MYLLTILGLCFVLPQPCEDMELARNGPYAYALFVLVFKVLELQNR